MSDRIGDVFARLYSEAIYSSSTSATKRDMNEDLECIETALAEAIAERDVLRADHRIVMIAARKLLNQQNAQQSFWDSLHWLRMAVEAIDRKEAAK